MKAITLSLPPFRTNCYIVFSEVGGECIIIDPASNAEKIKETISENKLKPKCIYLTHGHFDHICAVPELREFYNVPLYIHEGDADMIITPEFNCSAKAGRKPVSLSPADKLLKDGDEITIDSHVMRVMHTPGHSRGSSVLISDSEIFSGDTIFLNTHGRCDLYGGDFEKIKESIVKILALDENLKVYPGHGRPTTVRNERVFYFGE